MTHHKYFDFHNLSTILLGGFRRWTMRFLARFGRTVDLGAPLGHRLGLDKGKAATRAPIGAILAELRTFEGLLTGRGGELQRAAVQTACEPQASIPNERS